MMRYDNIKMISCRSLDAIIVTDNTVWTPSRVYKINDVTNAQTFDNVKIALTHDEEIFVWKDGYSTYSVDHPCEWASSTPKKFMLDEFLFL